MGGSKGPSSDSRGRNKSSSTSSSGRNSNSNSNSANFTLQTGEDDEAVVVYSEEAHSAQAFDPAEDLPESAAALAATLSAAGGAPGIPPLYPAEASSLGGSGSPGTGGSPGAGHGPGDGTQGGDPSASSATFASSRRSVMNRSRSGRQQGHAEKPPVFRSWKERERAAGTNPGSPGGTTSTTSAGTGTNTSAGNSGLGGGAQVRGGPRLCSTLGSPGELTSRGLGAADLSRWAAEGNMWSGAGAGAGSGVGRHQGGLAWAESEKGAKGSPWSIGLGDHNSSDGSPPIGGVPRTGRGAHPGGTGGAPSSKGTSLLTKLSSMKGLKGSIIALPDSKKKTTGASRRTLSDGGDSALGEAHAGPSAGTGAGALGVPFGVGGMHQGRQGAGSPAPGNTRGPRLTSRSRSITSSEAVAGAAHASRTSPGPRASLLRDRSFSGRYSSSRTNEALGAEEPRREARPHILRSASQDHSGVGLSQGKGHGHGQGEDAPDSPWALQRRIRDKIPDTASVSESPLAHHRHTKDQASPALPHIVTSGTSGSGRPPAIPLPCSPPPPPPSNLSPADAPSQIPHESHTASEISGEPAVRPRAASVGPPERAQHGEGALPSGSKDDSASAAPGSAGGTGAGTLSARQQLSTEERIKLWEVEKERGHGHARAEGEEEGGGHTKGRSRAHRGSSAHRERHGGGAAGAQGQERGHGSSRGATTALGSTASAPPGIDQGSDISSEVRRRMACHIVTIVAARNW